MRVEPEQLTRTFEKKCYYNQEVRDLIPTLYRELGSGLKGGTFYQSKSKKPTEEYHYDPAEVLRRAGNVGEKGSVLLSHVNRIV